MSVTPEELAAALADGEEFKCPECGKPFEQEINLRRHIAVAHKSGASTPGRERPKTSTGTKVVASEARAREEVDKAVGTMIGFGSLMAGAGILPYTGLTIAGVQDPTTKVWVVRSRALMAGGILFDHAKRDARVLEALIRFNRIFEGSAIVDVVGSLAAGVAVDLGTPPELEVGFGRFQFQPIRSAIGDVVDFVKENMEPPPGEAPAPESNGAIPPPKRKRGAKVVEGGVTAT